MSSPFLVVDRPQIVCINEPGQAVTRVVVDGRWGDGLRQEVSQVLRACVVEAPRVLLVDLTRLQDPVGESLSTWRTAARYAIQADPPVTVILGAAPPAVRHRLATGDGEPAMVVADTVDAALEAVPRLAGGIRQHHMALQAQHTASLLARRMVCDACRDLDVLHLIRPARLIMSELVTNSVRHAGTDLDVWVSLRGPALHLAVQDRARAVPRLLGTGSRHRVERLAPGTGLQVVSAAAIKWGALPCRNGKVVWATLATGAGRSS